MKRCRVYKPKKFASHLEYRAVPLPGRRFGRIRYSGRYPAYVAQLPKSLTRSAVDGSPLSRQELTEQQHRRILLALTKVFARRGYQAATVDNLIAAAKISMGSFYDHFDGKEDCLLQIYDLVVGEARERIAAAMPDSKDWTRRTYAGMHAALTYLAENQMAARVVLLEAQTAGPESVRRYNRDLAELAAFLRGGRAISAFKAELPPDFEDVTASGLAWLLASRLVHGEIGDVDTLFREMAEVALEPYLGADQIAKSIVAFDPAAA
jgi:AcrR family transcriptional regulator